MEKLKIVSWNLNGIRACHKKGLGQYIEETRPDIFCVQETKAHIDQVEPDVQSLSYENYYWSSAIRKGYSGVATFSDLLPSTHADGWGLKQYDSEGRIMITDWDQFLLYNIYFPNGGSGEERHLFKQQFLKDLNGHMKEQINKGREIILVGDYNVAHKPVDVYDPVRLSKESGFLPEEREWFDQFLGLGFVDTFRHTHEGEKNRYSWWSYRELARINNRGWRIDYICCTKGLVANLLSADIEDKVEGSDHCPVVAEFQF